MISEKDFIAKIKQYDNSGLEFDSIDTINDVVAGTMRPLKKRGIYTNEFTIINLAGFEAINEDTVLNLFNVIPPGPKEMDRRRTHLVVGRYSQAILPLVFVECGNSKYLLLQKRSPLNYGFTPATELFRDYISGGHSPDIERYFYTNFGSVLKNGSAVRIRNLGYFWESIGIISSNVNIAVLHVKFSDKDALKQVEKELTENFANSTNIAGPRSVFFEDVENIRKYYASLVKQVPHEGEYYLQDLISITGLFWFFRYLSAKNKKEDELVTSIVQ